jgi:S-DNA-T family DNA segregation ATPase FtsK/SpoIIIE
MNQSKQPLEKNALRTPRPVDQVQQKNKNEKGLSPLQEVDAFSRSRSSSRDSHRRESSRGLSDVQALLQGAKTNKREKGGRAQVATRFSLRDAFSKRFAIDASMAQMLIEARWIMIGMIGVFLAMSLMTYSRADPSWSHTIGSAVVIKNMGGRIGAWAADMMLFLFGFSAWLWCIVFARNIQEGLRHISSIKAVKTSGAVEESIFPQYARAESILRSVGFFLLLLGATSLEFVRMNWMKVSLPNHHGGVLGELFGGVSLAQLGFTGSTLLFLLLMMTGSSFYFQFSWIMAAEKIGEWIELGIEYIDQLRAPEIVDGEQPVPFSAGWVCPDKDHEIPVLTAVIDPVVSPKVSPDVSPDVSPEVSPKVTLEVTPKVSHSVRPAVSKQSTESSQNALRSEPTIGISSVPYPHMDDLRKREPSFSAEENVSDVYLCAPVSALTTSLPSVPTTVPTTLSATLLATLPATLPAKLPSTLPSAEMNTKAPSSLIGNDAVAALVRSAATTVRPNERPPLFIVPPSEGTNSVNKPASSAVSIIVAANVSTPKPKKPDENGPSPMPPLHLLDPAPAAQQTMTNDALEATSRLIERKLGEFGVEVKVVAAYPGPVITRYEIDPAMGVKGSQIVGLARDLARALSLTSIRVVETIPGKNCMGLELPNPKRQIVRLTEILNSQAYAESKSPLTVALGKDIGGNPVIADLAKMPHLLVAGTTGSGKSVGINATILSLLYKSDPKDVRLILIDPKMLELSIYEGIPHLLAPVVTDMRQAGHALNWAVNEMERRYKLMSKMGVRNLGGFNQKIEDAAAIEQHIPNPFSLTPEAPEPLEKLPTIVIFIDELADMMMVVGKKVEELIARIAQKARAAGIHLILATQRPSVDVITGLIKANVPTRIAFQVSSKIDSRTILDQMGAESLLGMGDMLYLPPGSGFPMRVHGAFVSDEEVHRVVDYLKLHGDANYVDGILESMEGAGEGGVARGMGDADGEVDDLYDQAVAIVLQQKKASISLVQRHLRIGYNRAARLLESMEQAGVVSTMKSNGNRDILTRSNDEQG